VIVIGIFVGLAYSRERNTEFERFVRRVVTDSGAMPKLVASDQDGEHLQWRLGSAGRQRLLFVTSSGGQREVAFRDVEAIFAPGDELVEMISGATARVNDVAGERTAKLTLASSGYSVWSWRSSTQS
jgi:hypothetical protein